MRSYISFLATVLASQCMALDIPSNIQSFYDSVKSAGSCSNKLSGEFSAGDGPSSKSIDSSIRPSVDTMQHSHTAEIISTTTKSYIFKELGVRWLIWTLTVMERRVERAMMDVAVLRLIPRVRHHSRIRWHRIRRA